MSLLGFSFLTPAKTPAKSHKTPSKTAKRDARGNPDARLIKCELVVYRAYNILPGHSLVFVAAQCDDKTTSSTVMTVSQGEAEFKTKLSLVTAVIPLPDGQGYESQPLHVQLKEVKHSKERLYGGLTVDLAHFLPLAMEHTHCNQSLKMALWKDNCSLPTHLHMAITVSWLEVRADESVRGHHQQKLLELPFLAEPLPHDEALTPPPLPAAVPASPVEVGDAGSATTPIPWASLGESLWEPPSVKPTPHTRFSTAHPRLEVSAEEDTPYTVAQTEDKGASASHARDRHKSIKPRRLDEPAAEVTRIMLSTDHVTLPVRDKEPTHMRRVRALVGEAFHGFIEVMDADGDKVYFPPKLNIKVAVPGGNTTPQMHVGHVDADGCIPLWFVPEEPGLHVVCAKLGKTILIDEDTVIEAVAGATRHVASSCELAGPAATEPVIAMAMPVKLVILSKNFSLGQSMTGQERVDVDVCSPSKGVSRMPVHFAEHHFEAFLWCREEGTHTVRVMVDGELIEGHACWHNAGVSLAVQVMEQPLCLSTSRCFGGGLYTCRVGKPSEFSIQGQDLAGKKLRTGGAALRVTVEQKSGRGERIVDGQVIDNCDGSYLVRYEAPRAKPYLVTVSLAGSCIKFTGNAEPGHVHLPSCTLKVTPSSLKVVAGKEAVLQLVRRDVYGHRTVADSSMPRLTADAHGPGPTHLEMVEEKGSSARLHFSATTAGRYAVQIYSGVENDLYPRCPVHLEVTAAPLSLLRTVSTIPEPAVDLQPTAEGEEEEEEEQEADRPPAAVSTAWRRASVAARGVWRVVAGSPIVVLLTAKDAYDNPVPWGEVGADAIEAVITRGGDQSDGAMQLDRIALSETQFRLTGCVKLAGSYMLSIKIQNTLLPSWPRKLTVAAGECFLAATRCTVLTRAPLHASEAVVVRLEPHDVFGNRLLELHAPVECTLELAEPASEEMLASELNRGGKASVAVENNGDGTYTLTLRPPTPGRWLLKPTIDGLRAGQPIPLLVGSPRAAPDTYELRVNGVTTTRHVTQGADSTLTLHPTPTAVDGPPAVLVTLQSPSGVITAVPMHVDHLGGLSGRVAWGTPGPYVLRALVGQHPVSNNHAEVLCFANTKEAEDVRLAKGDVPVRATLTTLARLKASQLRPEGSAEGPVESAELRGLRTWLEAPEHLSAVRSVVGWDQSDGCSEVARAAPRTRGELLLAAASAAGPEGDDGVVDPTAPPGLLATSTFSGDALTECVAGERAFFELTLKDADGNEPTGWEVRATLRRDGAENKVNVHRRRTGASCDYELTVAGRWTLVVTAETAADKSSTGKRDNWAPGVAQPPTTFTRSFAVTCRAAKADYHACSVDVSTLPEPWVAGCWGAVTVELRDRFNNLLGAEPAAELVLTAEGRGPGTLRTLVEPASPDHPCRVFVKADVEGEYSVSVLMEKRIQLGLRKGLKPLANTPFSITVVADRPADPSEPTRVRAGEDVLVEVRSTAFGGWGDANVAPAWVQAEASGTGESVLLVQADASPERLVFAHRFNQAGHYRLTANLSGDTVQLGILDVRADAVSLGACTVHGAVPSQINCHERYDVVLTVRDQFGNVVGDTPPDVVTATLRAADGDPTVVATAVDVTSLGGGLYSLSWSVRNPGALQLVVAAGDVESSVPSVAFTAVADALNGDDCFVVTRLPETLECGSSHQLTVMATQEAGEEGYLRILTGQECVSVVLTSPTGTRHTIRTEFVEPTFRATLHFLEAGPHSVQVVVNGREVPRTPLAVEVLVAPLHLPSSNITWATRGVHDTCCAGDEHTVVVQGRDRLGNEVAEGAFKSLSVQTIDANGKAFTIGIQEVRQGVCRITFKVIQAGAFSLVLAAEHDKSNTREVQGMCLPGEPDPARFSVDTARLAAEGGWVAGTYQSLVVVRRDRFGNRLKRGRNPHKEDPDHFTQYDVQMEGPGPVLPELVEVGDGSFEVRLTGCFAGAYEITLTRGGKALPGSPYKARIHPALPNSLTCLTSVNGVRSQDGMLFCRVGATATVTITPRDAWGNHTPLPPSKRVSVQLIPQGKFSIVKGPEFTKEPAAKAKAKAKDGEKYVEQWSCMVTEKGVYAMWLFLDADVMAGWPRLLNVSVARDPKGLNEERSQRSTSPNKLHVLLEGMQLDLTSPISVPVPDEKPAQTPEMSPVLTPPMPKAPPVSPALTPPAGNSPTGAAGVTGEAVLDEAGSALLAGSAVGFGSEISAISSQRSGSHR